MVRRTRHAAYEIRYHFVGVPKYRRKVLVGGIPERLTVLLSEKTQEMGGEIIDLAIQPDQVHLFGIFPPTLAPHPIMHGLKGYTAFMLRKAFPPSRADFRICGPVLTTSAHQETCRLKPSSVTLMSKRGGR